MVTTSQSVPDGPKLSDAVRLAQLGLRPLWLSSSFAPDRQAGKMPLDPDWKSYEYIPPEQVTKPPGPGCNLGHICGRVPGAPVCCVGVNANTPSVISFIEKELGHTPWRVKTSRGEILNYRYPEGDVLIPQGSKLRASPIDILADGCWEIDPPSIHRRGDIYQEPEPWTPLLIASAPVFDMSKLLVPANLPLMEDLRKVIEQISMTSPAMNWLGCYAEQFDPMVQEIIRGIIPKHMRMAFDVGLQASEAGSKVTRPVADVSREVASQLRTVLAAQQQEPANPGEPFSIEGVIRHVSRTSDRFTFDVTLKQGEIVFTIKGLDGLQIKDWKIISARALEGKMALSESNKAKKIWKDLYEKAIPSCADMMDDTEMSVIDAARDHVLEMLRTSKPGETKDDLRRGHIFRKDTEVWVYPAHIIHSVRTAMSADHVQRKDIITAIHECGGTEKNGRLPSDQRMKVYCFPRSRIEDDDAKMESSE